jgi:tRNA threonylcarbamoyl adenosine modification protein YeaZ
LSQILSDAQRTFFAFDMTLTPASLQQSYGLGIDTTTAALNLGIGAHHSAYRTQTWHLERALSAQLHPLLQGFMVPQHWSDLAWIAVLRGPGSFTGTRLGVVTARTLAQQLNLPLFGWSNLAIAAWIAAQSHGQKDCTFAIALAGQQSMVYGAVYQVQVAQRLVSAPIPDRLMPEAEWQQLVSCTSGIDQVIQLEQALDPEQLAQAMLTLSWQAWHSGERPLWSEVLPYYG